MAGAACTVEAATVQVAVVVAVVGSRAAAKAKGAVARRRATRPEERLIQQRLQQ